MNTFNKFLIGVSGPGIGVTISLSTAEDWLRISSLLVGILVGILSGVSIWLSIRRKWREAKGKIKPMKREEFDEETTTV